MFLSQILRSDLYPFGIKHYQQQLSRKEWCIKQKEGGGRGWDGEPASLTHGHEFEQSWEDGGGERSLLEWHRAAVRGLAASDTTQWQNGNSDAFIARSQ